MGALEVVVSEEDMALKITGGQSRMMRSGLETKVSGGEVVRWSVEVRKQESCEARG